MNPHTRSRARRISLLLHRWHRRIGVMISVFVIWMAVSGWLLNHTAFFDLAHRSVTTHLIALRYGLNEALPTQAFNADKHWLTFTDESAWLDGKLLSTPLPQPLGLIADAKTIYIANASTLLLFNDNGALIDSESTNLLPIPTITRIGRGCNGIVIADPQKQFASGDGVNWEMCKGDVQWSSAQPLTEYQLAIIKPLVQPGVSLERLIQDLHSGRFFGTWGPFFVDAIGLAFVLLALSGLWMFSHQRKQRAHRH